MLNLLIRNNTYTLHIDYMETKNIKLDTIEEAIEAFRAGQFVIVVDDEDRENEGDLIMAAEKVTADHVNFMITNAVFVPRSPYRAAANSGLPIRWPTTHRCSALRLPSLWISSKAVPLEFPHTTALRLYGLLPIRLRCRRHSDARGMCIRFMPRMRGCCVVRDIRRPEWISHVWQDCIPRQLSLRF